MMIFYWIVLFTLTIISMVLIYIAGYVVRENQLLIIIVAFFLTALTLILSLWLLF